MIPYHQMNKKKSTNIYVNNSKLYEELVKRKEQIKESEKQGLPKPQISNFVGKCIMDIAEHLSRMPSFIGYTFREEMIGDGYENVILYIDSFDPSKTKNPFAYFTMIIYNAFLRRIEREKKQLYIKYKSTQNYGIFNNFELLDNDTQQKQFETFDNIISYIHEYETKRNEKKKKGK